MPNLLQTGAASTLVVSQYVDVGVPVNSPDAFKKVTRGLSPESRHAVASSLTLLSLMDGRPGMPSPDLVRRHVTQLLSTLEA